LLGYSGRDLILGGSGNDDLNGGRGRDRLLGQRGNDTLTGQNVPIHAEVPDTCKGGPGKDRVYFC
jgi:Ca2+-binding RTX toxin-like protein